MPGTDTDTGDKSQAPVLEVRGLTVRLPANADRENAVDDITLTVRRREILCVVGESGSGNPSPHTPSWVCCPSVSSGPPPARSCGRAGICRA